MSSRVFWAIIDRVWSKTAGASRQRPPGFRRGARGGLVACLSVSGGRPIPEHWLETRAGKAPARSLPWDPETPRRRRPEPLPTSFTRALSKVSVISFSLASPTRCLSWIWGLFEWELVLVRMMQNHAPYFPWVPFMG